MIPSTGHLRRIRLCWLVCLLVGGCATLKQPAVTAQRDTSESISALQSISEAVSGQEISSQQLRELSRQIQEDEEAGRAVRAISGTLDGSSPKVKYCPICGKRFSPKMKVCPIHQVELKEVEE